MQLGSYILRNNIFVAPMAGITDQPFRQLCKELGAGYAVSEMAAANPRLWQSKKSRNRTNHDGETEPKAVQIAGSDPIQMAECARYNVDNGAQIIDINMGCPAKKVCNNWCGSALLQNEKLVGDILDAVVGATSVPVTLKFRTGWDRSNKNALTIAKIAESAGISMLTLHGRTREDAYHGDAEYETIAQVKKHVSIPVVANGDIDTPEKALTVLQTTGVDAIMIGRAAQGRPWLFREIDYYLQTGSLLEPPYVEEAIRRIQQHLLNHYAFYGKEAGVRSARKHIAWYVKNLQGGDAFRQVINRIDSCELQLKKVITFFKSQLEYGERLQYGVRPNKLVVGHEDMSPTC